MIDAIVPSKAVAQLAERGIKISERTLRAKARELGACRVFGKAMFLMPSDITRIIDAAQPEPRPCNSTKDGKSGISISAWREKDTEALLDRVTTKKPGKLRRKSGRANVRLIVSDRSA